MMPRFDPRVLPLMALFIYGLCLTAGALIGGLWAAAGIVLGLTAYATASWHQGTCLRLPKNLFFMTLAFLGIAALHTLVSSFPEKSGSLWINLATTYIPLCLLFSPSLRDSLASPRFMTVLTIGTVVGALALGIELHLRGPLLATLHGTDASIAKYNRGMSYLVLMAMPVLAILWNSNHRWLIAPFLLILIFPTGLTESRAAKLALLLACATIVLAMLVPRLATVGLSVCLALAASWPFLAQWIFAHYQDTLAHIPDSWHHRIEIWDYMSYRILEKPLLGWGLGASGEVDYALPHGQLYHFAHERAGHAHNFITQLWVDMGVIGLLCALVFGATTLRQCAKLPTTLRPFALGAWVGSFTLALVAYNFWTDSLMAAFALTALAFTLIPNTKRT